MSLFPVVMPVGPGVVSGTVWSLFLICPRGLCHSCLDSTILAQTLCSAPQDNLCLALGGMHKGVTLSPPHPAMQLPGSVWVTLPVPSCLDTSAPSLRPESSGKLSFPLRYSRLSLPHHPSSLLPNLGSLGPKHRAGTVVTEASQRVIWILTL